VINHPGPGAGKISQAGSPAALGCNRAALLRARSRRVGGRQDPV